MSSDPEKLIDGKAVAETIFSEVAAETSDFSKRRRPPFLAVVIAGEDPASQAYVKSKVTAAARCGIGSTLIELAATVEAAYLLDRLDRLNADPGVDGILVQMPLPREHLAGQGRRRIASLQYRASRVGQAPFYPLHAARHPGAACALRRPDGRETRRCRREKPSRRKTRRAASFAKARERQRDRHHLPFPDARSRIGDAGSGYPHRCYRQGACDQRRHDQGRSGGH